MQELEKKLNYTFRNPALLGEALSHSSYANEHRANHLNSNERLEFLGDSVLGFVTAEFLFAQHPNLPEGDLTRIRAALVCEQSLYEVARKLELGQYLKEPLDSFSGRWEMFGDVQNPEKTGSKLLSMLIAEGKDPAEYTGGLSGDAFQSHDARFGYPRGCGDRSSGRRAADRQLGNYLQYS